MGDIVVRLFPQHTPKTHENFVTHARNGYYNGLLFHRVIRGFMVSGVLCLVRSKCSQLVGRFKLAIPKAMGQAARALGEVTEQLVRLAALSDSFMLKASSTTSFTLICTTTAPVF
jgi:hypothetical protein